MCNKIRTEVEAYLAQYPPALSLFRKIMKVGDVYIVGGLLREYRDNGKIQELRDADFSINIKNRELWKELLNEMSHTLNHFGGYKFMCSGFIVDIWDVAETWAFQKHFIEVEDKDYFEHLTDSVYLNIDAIAYDLSNDKWNDSGYRKAMESNILDLVLAENPYIELNLLRAMVLRRKYNMQYSKKLKNVILTYSEHKEFVADLMMIQQNRYGYKVLSEIAINAEIQKCKENK